MRSTSSLASVFGLAAVVALSACAAPEDDGAVAGDNAFSSNQATQLDFEFDGELVSDYVWDEKQTIESQLLFTIGQLNGDNSVGRLDNLTLTNVKKVADGDKTKVTYHAKFPVAWGSKTNLPTKYDFILARDVSSAGQDAFTEKHKESCVDWGAHDVDSGSMWYYYRPTKSDCELADDEVTRTTATVKRSAENTTNKYPEYQKVWEDDALEIVAIFGKYEAGATSGDAGIDGFNEFIRSMRTQLGPLHPTTTPATLATNPGPGVQDVTFEATLADGKKVKVTAFLVDAITQVWSGFQQRYEAVSATADMIAYNGHSGLGQNVRALARMGKWKAKQYQIFFMNGCDSFAYVDGSLAQTRAALNPDDPSGTKYMEFVTNAMPSFFASMPNASISIMKGLLSYDAPKTYDQIFEDVDTSEVVLVTGEEDNVFQPGMQIGSGGH